MPRRAVKPGFVALRRAHWRHRVSNALGATSACKRALRRCRQTCALVYEWSEVLAAAGAKVAHARVVQQMLDHPKYPQVSQRPVAASQSHYARSSEPCM